MCRHSNTNVHMTWPVARAQVLRKRCSSIHCSNLAAAEFTQSLASYCPSHVALRNIETRPTATSFHPKTRSSWVVIQHHRIWEQGGISSKLNKIFSRWHRSLVLAGEDVDDLRVRVAWSLGSRSLKQRILQCNCIK